MSRVATIKKRRICGIVAAMIVFSLALYGLISTTVDYDPDLPVYIFSDISECEGFASYQNGDAEIIRYDAPDRDDDLKDLKYHAFYATEYRSSDLRFQIFAYEFEDAEEAMKYFENATGKSIIGTNVLGNDLYPETNFSTSLGMSRYERTVIDNGRAYHITAPKKYANAVERLLADIFSKQLGL